MANGKMVKNVVKENKSGQMAPFIKASFKMIWQTVLDVSFILVEMFMKVIGSKIRLKEKESIYIQMGRCIRDNG